MQKDGEKKGKRKKKDKEEEKVNTTPQKDQQSEDPLINIRN